VVPELVTGRKKIFGSFFLFARSVFAAPSHRTTPTKRSPTPDQAGHRVSDLSVLFRNDRNLLFPN
jgi:hypothetical protein